MVEAAEDQRARPPLPKLGSSRSTPATPSRLKHSSPQTNFSNNAMRRTRDRIAVGFTNRPNSTQSSRSSTQASVRSSVPENGERSAKTRQFTGTMASKDWQDREVRGQVREKILQRRVNVVPLLKEKALNGYVSSSDMRTALRKMHIGLNEDEMAFCAGARQGEPDDFVDVRDFVESLTVPDYEEYDPMGQSKARECKALKKLAFPRRSKADQWTQGEKDSEAAVDVGQDVGDVADKPQTAQTGSNTPGDELRPNVLVNKRQARRHVKSLARKLKERGLSVLEMFRDIDGDGSGVIEKSEFEEALRKRADLGVLQPQIDDVWSYIDKDGNSNINYLELVAALDDDATSSKDPSRPGTRTRPGSQASTASADSRQQVAFGDPWAQRKGIRSPIL